MAHEVEQTLHVSRSATVYRIPARSPSGWHSGEWKNSDKIFEGRMRVVSRGEVCEVRLEDPSTGELFAMCPVPYGKRNMYVEPAVDSSRYHVIRVEDPVSKQHAFLGLGFTERSESFDFTEALVRHDKFVERDRASRSMAAGTSAASGSASSTAPAAHVGSGGGAGDEVRALYAQNNDFTLKQGETIKVNIKKPAGKANGLVSSASAHTPLLVPLHPPPGPAATPPSAPTSFVQDHAVSAGATALQHPSQGGTSTDLLQVCAEPAVTWPAVTAAAAAPPPPAQGFQHSVHALNPTNTGAVTGETNWATFD